MNLATLLSFAAALLQLSMGAIFLVIARAPNWQRARLFSVIAFSAAAYSGVDVLFSINGLDPQLVRITGVANYLFASIHSAAWVLFAYASADHPWRSLATRYRVLVVLTLAMGIAALVPGVATGERVQAVAVPALGVVYQQAVTTPFSDFLGAWLLLMLALPFVRFWRAWRSGEPGAGVRVAGFLVFYACAVAEVLVTDGVIQFLYMADVGFLAIVVTVLVESVRRVIADAQALERLGKQLAQQVDHRTRERDQARDALVHAERLAALGQLAAGVGHEINNPLTYVRANLEAMAEGVTKQMLPQDARELLDEALNGTDRIQRVVADLRAYALPASETRERVALPRVVQSALKVASHQLRHHAAVETHFDATKPVHVDAMRLSQVFVNLLVNAGQAVKAARPERPCIVVTVRMCSTSEACVEIQDNGVGMSDETLRRLGEPYYSTRVDQGGTGLGLFVARGIVESFGGSLSFESREGQGTLARVTLPAIESEPACASSTALARSVPPAALSTGGASGSERVRVLVIDDDEIVAHTVERLLDRCEVVIALGGQPALELLAQDAAFDAIICDVMMPGLSGVQLYDQLAARNPALLPRLVFMTGGATMTEVAEFLARDGVRHITKPFDRRAFNALVAALHS